MNHDPYVIAAKFKAEGVQRQVSWSRWVQITALRPGMDAKDWYAIFDSVEAALPEIRKRNHLANPTHLDTLFGCNVEITELPNGVFEMRWENGLTGSNPPTYPPDPARFVAIAKE